MCLSHRLVESRRPGAVRRSRVVDDLDHHVVDTALPRDHDGCAGRVDLQRRGEHRVRRHDRDDHLAQGGFVDVGRQGEDGALGEVRDVGEVIREVQHPGRAWRRPDGTDTAAGQFVEDRVGLVPGQLREIADRGGAENVSRGEGETRGTHHRRQSDRRDRVPAQREERTGHRDLFDAEDGADDPRHDMFGVGGGLGVGLVVHEHVELRSGKRLPVEFSGAAEGRVGQRHPQGGPHIGGQGPRDGLPRTAEAFLALGSDEVADEVFGAPRYLGQGHRGLPYSGDGREHRLDLAQLDPLAAELDLEVATAQVFQLPGPVAADQVAGAVEPGPLPERVGDEAIGGQIGARGVSASELDSAEIQLARDTGRDRPKTGIQNEALGVPDRPPDRDHLAVVTERGGGDLDGGLGGTEEVVDPHVRQRGTDLAEGGRRQRLARTVEMSQTREQAARGVVEDFGEHRQQGRDEVHGGDVFVVDQPSDGVRVEVCVIRRDDHPRSGHRRREQLRHRDVEGHRRLQQDAAIRTDSEFFYAPAQSVEHSAVGHRDALGTPRRPGGEQGVGGMVREERRPTLGIGDGRRVEIHRIRGVDHDDPVQEAADHCDARGDETDLRSRDVDHVADPVRRRIGRHRDVLPSRGEDGVDRDDQLDRPRNAHDDAVLRTDAGRDQLAGEYRHACRELPVCDRPAGAAQGDRVR
ncbi:hypothetical protein BPODLACK_03287 [Gordonia sp. YY1]|nr:hypothetical protein BPODLACK_03287 [Gordonia sp. YY1]